MIGEKWKKKQKKGGIYSSHNVESRKMTAKT